MGSVLGDESNSIVCKLDELYFEIDAIISQNKSTDLLKPIVKQINILSSDLDKLLINFPGTSDSTEKEEVKCFVKDQRIKRGQYDAKVTEYLQSAELSSKEIASILSVPRTLRSYTSRSRRSSSSSSASSSVLLAKSVAKEETARLKLQHLKEKQRLAREMHEAKERLELLEVQQELKEANLNRQVIQEELEHGGYLPDEAEKDQESSDAVSEKEGVLSYPSPFQVKQPNVNTEQSEIAPQTSCQEDNWRRTKMKPISRTDHLKFVKEHDRVTEQANSSKAKKHEVQFHVNTAQSHAEMERCNTREGVDETIPKAPSWNSQRSANGSLNRSNAVDSVSLPPNWAKLMELPKIEIFKFTGNPMDYTKFIKTFETNVESFTEDASRCLLLLIQHCEGEAKRLIEFCLLLNPEEGYQKAKDILKQNFGRKNVIARAHIEKLHSESFIKEGDERGFVNLSHHLEECQLIFRRLNLESDINNFDTISKIAKRLPNASQNRWIRAASEIERKGEDPNFGDFVKFVKCEAEVARSPYARVMSKIPKKAKFSTHMARLTEETKTGSTHYNNTNCFMCSENHALESCSVFKAKPVSERITFMRQNRLCDNCCKKGHISRYCYKDKMCTVEGCRMKHHTLLHQERNRASRATSGGQPGTGTASITQKTVAMTSTMQSGGDSSKVFLNIVPVRVTAGNNSVDTLAFLDQGSTTTLCKDCLLDKLEVRGEKASYAITTINQTTEWHSGRKAEMSVSSVLGGDAIDLRNVYCVESLPIYPNPPVTEEELQEWPHLKGINIPTTENEEVMLLIGVDHSEAFWTLDERHGEKSQPYAIKTVLGWSLIGCDTRNESKSFNINFIRKSDQLLQEQVECLWKLDQVPDVTSLCAEMSKNDRYALKLLDGSKNFVNGHYQFGLLWRPGAPTLTSNYPQAFSRLQNLKRRFSKNAELQAMYTSAIDDYLSKGYAEPLRESDVSFENTEPCWYLPHHAVFHPKKPNKIRVVFDCAARCNGTSLNEQLLAGPDILNSLIGVLSRFRKEKIALVADIEAMYHQVAVDPKDQRYLRFLWWPNGDTSLTPSHYCMKVHVFGATSSPTCALYALRETANDHASHYSEAAVQTVLSNFYMDDCLKSISSVEKATDLHNEVTNLLKHGGFRLTKWLSNDKRLLEHISSHERAKVVVDLNNVGNSCERVLGVQWDFENDKFQFNVCLNEKPFTRRGILSVASSLFDPLGFVAPVVLKAKFLLQNLCREGLGWDERIPDDYVQVWKQWLLELPLLSDLKIDRCFKEFFHSEQVQIHFFSDASQDAYGVVAYLRVRDANDNVTCKFLIGKARLAPIKTVSIPRLELTAACLAVKLNKMIKHELQEPNWDTFFWTDSTAVLYMISNISKRYQTFVANRLAKIDELSEPKQWHYVNSSSNPADDATHGLMGANLDANSRWILGPEFLYSPEKCWPQPPCVLPILPDEFSILRKTVSATKTVVNGVCVPLIDRFARFSSWHRLKTAVAWILRLKNCLMKKDILNGPLTVEEMNNAERIIIQCVQLEAFTKEINDLSSKSKAFVHKTSSLRKLNPLLFEGILRVGGRIDQAPVSFDVKHPVILPSQHHVTKIIIENYHQQVGHAGMSHTWASLRERYWIVRGASAVRRVLGQCLQCKRRNVNAGQQIMSELPKCRLTPNNPPFYFTGIDYFGPFFVKQGRSRQKRWGCIFTCLSSRCVHIEVVASMSADAFINALRRFIARRGKPSDIYSDNGSNFIGAEKELREALILFNTVAVEKHLLQKSIQWHFNPPYASNMGGVWERLIRSFRRILRYLLTQQTVSDDTLLTLMIEVESILNSRPLTPVTMDPEAEVPLTPNHLLLMREVANLSPAILTSADNYASKRWRQVQYLAQQFWLRWSKEYLQNLQPRVKWQTEKDNFKVDDIVLVYDENAPRGKWPLGRVVKVYPDRCHRVRQVLVKTVTSTLRRPISKLFKIIDNEKQN